ARSVSSASPIRAERFPVDPLVDFCRARSNLKSLVQLSWHTASTSTDSSEGRNTERHRNDARTSCGFRRKHLSSPNLIHETAEAMRMPAILCHMPNGSDLWDSG